MLDYDQDRPCEHPDFLATVEVVRLKKTDEGPVTGYIAEVQVRCAVCDEPFRWIVTDHGMSLREPLASVDEITLNAPLRPASSDDDFGMGLPGFRVHLRGPDDPRPDRSDCNVDIPVESGMETVDRPDFPPHPYDENDHGIIGPR